MRKISFIVFLSVLLLSCGGGNEQDKSSEAASDSVKPAVSVSDDPDYQKGLALISNSDCLTCHKIKETLVGPAYKDVANKYENTAANLTMLAGKVISGGAGVWGQIPMSPHAGLSQADAEQMVKYVLLLKNMPD